MRASFGLGSRAFVSHLSIFAPHPHPIPLCDEVIGVEEILQAFLLLLEQAFQFLGYSVTDLDGGAGTADVPRHDAFVNDETDGLLHQHAFLGEVQTIQEQHGDAENGGDGVDDALAGDVGRRAVDGLVDAVAEALAVWDAAETGAGEQTQTARDDRGFVGDDVSKEIRRDDDAVQGRGFLTMIMAAESISWCSNSNWGNSFSMVSVNTLRHSRLVARTLALSRLKTLLGGLLANARYAASRVIRSISLREYGSRSSAHSFSPSAGLASTRSPK